MVEGADLESLLCRNVYEGSNPSLSVTKTLNKSKYVTSLGCFRCQEYAYLHDLCCLMCLVSLSNQTLQKIFLRDTSVSPEILDFGILAFFGVVALLL